MEGPILAEFSSLNALTSKGHSGYGATPRDHLASPPREGHQDLRPSGVDDARMQRERLLRGEASYTSGSNDACVNEHFIEDKPNIAQFGVSCLLPKASSMEERERLLRRLEMCAKAREESTKIMSIRFAQRDAVKNDMRRDRQRYLEKLTGSQRDRDERWSRKLQRSPFAVDLVAENQRIDEENRVKDHIEQRRQRLVARRNREAHNSIFKRATAETDELDKLRAEKRLLLENERQLKALRDVEKSNARTAQILQDRRKQQAINQQEQMAQSRGPQLPKPPCPQSARSI
mmetsp:Transcript_76072/g.211469  ORF Transcript_76072/g.211469 Transcript_76072/m.211469 type:complete len:289 (-) Transcript_76072:54-920(-)